MDYRERITTEAGKRGGKPCIRDLRPQLLNPLADLSPGSTHLRDVGLATATDEMIWAHAEREEDTRPRRGGDKHARSRSEVGQ
jgi:hypothetical protein